MNNKKTISNVDPQEFGQLLIMSAYIAKMVGHTSPSLTVTDYFHPDENNATEVYFKDFMLLSSSKLSMNDFMKKWS